MTKTIRLEDDTYDRLSNLGNLKSTFDEAVKYLLDVHDNVKGMRINTNKYLQKQEEGNKK